ncbi:LLM class flavin-dependent oxidoreductase [Massilia pseudoviolaceinigra]|uniref:LLM class flavin-dependent oxidoreductase n=1 Tax=Massilia pseudoviolaceinigra TaxID=3057165 RepID=UPI0027964AA2|nr:LLM class flavin-dependent oxidoreductase [Massilia sp. CCM 9206]MDQ1923600.1 LLM class flavin-dependent oxidoreductase [Massilia sp. CCM 9206]
MNDIAINDTLYDGPALSVLDLVPITVGHSLGQALRNTRRLAQGAEALGFRRYWLAEHHNAASFASAATSVLMGYVAEGTSTIRVGAGGIMLPNHAPLMVAEQFGTLESLYPGRIDLGVGRSAGADPVAATRLKRGGEPRPFGAMLGELSAYFEEADPAAGVRAVPGAGLALPLYILGGSPAAAAFAGERGLPFAYAGHLKDDAAPSLAAYRSAFRPSAAQRAPYAMMSINVIGADSAAEAAWLATSRRRRVLGVMRARPLPLQAPAAFDTDGPDAAEQQALELALGASIEGDHAALRAGLGAIIARCAPDELLINTEIHDIDARLRSYEIVAEALMPRRAPPARTNSPTEPR